HEPPPDAPGTYCSPFTAYVPTPPRIPEPVYNRYSSRPVSASSARKSPVSSPVKTSPPAVAVTPATVGLGERYRQRTVPRAASSAVSHPLAWPAESEVYVPPMYSVPGTKRVVVPAWYVPHQSTAAT